MLALSAGTQGVVHFGRVNLGQISRALKLDRAGVQRGA